MTLADVTFSGNTPSTSADDCYGIVAGMDVAPGETAANINALDLTWGTGWQFLIKDAPDGATATSGAFGGIDYSLISGAAATFGIWSLSATATAPASLPTYVDFIVSLKSGNEYALWLFDDVKVDGDDGGSWTSVFKNNGNGGLQNLSHMSLFVRQGDEPTDVPQPPAEIPEPSGLALVGLAAFAAVSVRRRRART